MTDKPWHNKFFFVTTCPNNNISCKTWSMFVKKTECQNSVCHKKNVLTWHPRSDIRHLAGLGKNFQNHANMLLHLNQFPAIFVTWGPATAIFKYFWILLWKCLGASLVYWVLDTGLMSWGTSLVYWNTSLCVGPGTASTRGNIFVFLDVCYQVLGIK